MARYRSFQLTDSSDGWRSSRSLIDYDRKRPRTFGISHRSLCIGLVAVGLLLIVLTVLARSKNGLPSIMTSCPRIEQNAAIANLQHCAYSSALMKLASSPHLKLLDLGDNKLTTIPEQTLTLRRLEVLFLSNNQLEGGSDLTRLASLRVLSLKSNSLSQLDVRLPVSLEQLILTDNSLFTLPMGLASLTLRKIMATRNNLELLPDDFSSQTRLELVRLSHNELVSLPIGFWHMPRLAWVALAGNPLLGRSDGQKLEESIRFRDVELLEKLGEGTSGVVYHGHYGGQDVAVKIYKQSSSDGDYMDELALAARIQHPDIVNVHGVFLNPHAGLVMDYLPGYQPLADPPDVWSTLRCRYNPATQLTYQAVVGILSAVGRALAYLHSIKIAHGDVYAHNVMVHDTTGKALLGDFGASWSYAALPDSEHPLIEAIEMRAFGILAQELAGLAADSVRKDPRLQHIRALAERCLEPVLSMRPTFAEIVRAIA
eukprot:TRINITY_DN7146_c0_g1_i1.p2 TRINITY_DN7146_c0_g1~~TRINITY_DN7146_c0_g1_i1.p2  ORF type:complete len:485 (+),score=46.00 TRINITY_DN7146_c0_g1_i1:3187-4641(+)